MLRSSSKRYAINIQDMLYWTSTQKASSNNHTRNLHAILEYWYGNKMHTFREKCTK